MPIIKGTMGYTRFLVNSEAPISLGSVVEKLNNFKFRSLHEKGEDTETLGWSPYLNEYDERDIAHTDCLFDEKIVLSMRQDVITLPKALLKMLVKKGLSAYFKEHQKMADRQAKKEIELFEAKKLRSRVLPKTKVVEAMWCPKTSELRIFSRSQNLVDHFLDLFQQTFLLKPQRRDFVFEGARLTSIEPLAHQPIFQAPIRIDVQ